MVNARARPASRIASAIVKPGSPVRVTSVPSGEDVRDLIVGWCHVVEGAIERARQLMHVLGKARRIKDPRKPPQPDQPVDRWREVDPAERKLGGEMHASGGDRCDRAPSWILANA